MLEDQQISSSQHYSTNCDQIQQSQVPIYKPQKIEYYKDGFWYNEKNQKICGHIDSMTQKRCRNPFQCRIHNPQRKIYIPKEEQFYRKLIIGKWQQEEHLKFLICVQKIGIGRWLEIANKLGSRTSSQCQVHYFKLKEKLGLTDEQMKEHLDKQDFTFKDVPQKKQNQTDKQQKVERKPSQDSFSDKIHEIQHQNKVQFDTQGRIFNFENLNKNPEDKDSQIGEDGHYNIISSIQYYFQSGLNSSCNNVLLLPTTQLQSFE